MDRIISILAFVGSVGSLITAVYVFASNRKMREMQMKNKDVSIYLKEKSYLLMRNDGHNPCDTQETFEIPKFSQNCNCICRR